MGIDIIIKAHGENHYNLIEIYKNIKMAYENVGSKDKSFYYNELIEKIEK